MYADDIQLLASMFPTDIDQYRTMIENCVMSVHDWCSTRRLTLNPDKTEVIWFCSRANLGRIQNCTTSLHFDKIDIKPAETVLDSRLDMHAHISKTVSAGFFHLRRIRQLRRILPSELKQSLVSALILSRIDYCNVVRADLPASTLEPLERLLRAAVRYVADLRPRDHVTPTMQQLHWLTIKHRVTYKLCMLMHSVVYGYAPQYICELVTPVSSLPNRSRLRSSTSGLFDILRTRPPSAKGPSPYPVQLPGTVYRLMYVVRLLPTRDTFKRHLKSTLYDQAY